MSQQPPSGPPNPPGSGWGGPPQGPPPGQPPYGPPPQGQLPQGPPPGQYGPPPGQPPQGPPPGQYGPPPGQMPYGPPAGQYPGPPPSGGGKSKGLIIGIVIAVVVVVGGGFAAAFLLLGDANEPSSDDPLASARAFVDAWKDKDCDAIADLLTERLRGSALGECDPDDVQGEPTDPEITDESGDKATAAITVDGTDLELTLVKEDGKWLIDRIGGSASTTPPDQNG